MCQVMFWALGEENLQILAYVDLVGDIDSTADIINKLQSMWYGASCLLK